MSISVEEGLRMVVDASRICVGSALGLDFFWAQGLNREVDRFLVMKKSKKTGKDAASIQNILARVKSGFVASGNPVKKKKNPQKGSGERDHGVGGGSLLRVEPINARQRAVPDVSSPVSKGLWRHLRREETQELVSNRRPVDTRMSGEHKREEGVKRTDDELRSTRKMSSKHRRRDGRRRRKK
ncbi:hypothetical protein K438DRAFT_1766937 [Mycena galopus ATCC 62051]|nr:hypothetical protein K438DRAFT_1766937 [Mycena galopus ATCC 62051]